VVSQKVYITGMGWVTPLGDSLDAVWRRLLAGDSGFTHFPSPWRLRNYLAALIPDLPVELTASERLRRVAVRAIKLAIEDRGCGESDDFCYVLGTSLGAYLDRDGEPREGLDAWARGVTAELNSDMEPIVVSTACSSGADAIAIGFDLIRSGSVRKCICGGADVLTSSKRLAHSSLATMSPTRLRAFDVEHNGMLLGEGAAFLILEAEPEGRKSYGIVRGVGAANDAVSLTAPDPSGLGARRAIERSLAVGQIRPDAIGIVNAHGSGTPLNDATEAEAFRIVFDGAVRPKVFATKGNFGHSLGATGAIEAVATILSLNAGELPPITELENPIPFPLDLVRGNSVCHDSAFGLSLTLGFGGFDTSLIFEVT
jgi:3-oxoacyl-[acyl-carrier-protein] synthase II